ncbi:MAG TPA: galactokinase family protein [bacterium]|nr:galactokinase family protein [bacterium]HPN44375.1 galactokinase family protein [bacterium]
MSGEKLHVSAPGRICLFGEHQDYLGLSVITAAIDLRISIYGVIRRDRVLTLDLPDIGDKIIINLDRPVIYERERDYFRSVINVLQREGVTIEKGYDCTVRGNIPINSGTSSSSALIVAWIKFLLTAAGDARANDALVIAKLAHRAEVLEFNEPGGMMDHFACSFGSVLYIDFSTPDAYQQLPANLGKFVLGDSRQPKDTKGILKRVKEGALQALSLLQQQDPAITIHTISLAQLDHYRNLLTGPQYDVLYANVINRDLVQQAKTELLSKKFDPHKLGELLNRHQDELRERSQISTPKIDGMIDAALQAGALGAKINGSGGGGCMFAYAPDKYEQVAESIERAGGKAFIVEIGRGACEDDNSV